MTKEFNKNSETDFATGTGCYPELYQYQLNMSFISNKTASAINTCTVSQTGNNVNIIWNYDLSPEETVEQDNITNNHTTIMPWNPSLFNSCDYNSNGNQPLDYEWSDVIWDDIVITSPDHTCTPGTANIIMTTTGLYDIMVNVTTCLTEIGNTLTTTQGRLTLNDVYIENSNVCMDNIVGPVYIASGMIHVQENIIANDVIKLQCSIKSGDGQSETYRNSCRIAIHKLE